MRLTPQQKLAFKNYVDTARIASADLSFLLDSIERPIQLDWSEESLERLEVLFWEVLKDPTVLANHGGTDLFQHLLGQYLGESIIRSAGGAWTPCEDSNRFHGQPCIDGFGNARFERLFPVAIATGLESIAREQPHFPGAGRKAIMAEQLRKAMSVAARTK